MKLFETLRKLAAIRLATLALKAVLFAFISAGLVAGLAIGPAFALYNDQTRIFSPRAYQNDQPVYYRFTLNWNDPNIGTGQAFGALALGAFIDQIDCHVTTAFNAGTTNTITIGTTSANANEVVASGITAGTTGIYHLTSAAGLGLAVTASAGVTLYAKYAQTGTAATAGSVTCIIEYFNNNDM